LSEANALVNSLKICDPAVGSGHFLVSALNEIIAIKSELRILADSDEKLLRCDVTIENDELIVTVDDQIFEYNYKDAESQRMQEALFHEKETIIENCLFGVDINPKSVMICRLRLWIELLKNAYYRKPSTPLNPPLSGGKPFAPSHDAPPAGGLGRAGEGLQLETLPNIDINIKCGNSLVSRFALDSTPNLPPVSRNKLKELTEKYRRHVFEYKLSPANKAQLRKIIDGLKHDLENFGLPNDKDLIALRKKENEVAQLGFAFDKKGFETRQKLLTEVELLRKRFDEKERMVYINAFEWRFEFPEVLDEQGEFIGFDAIIGNPPYIRQEAIKEQKPALMEMFGSFYCGTADIYTYFYKTGLNLLKTGSTLCYIAPIKFMRAGYGKNTRDLLTTEARPLMVLDFGDLPIFDEATTYPSIVMVQTVGEKQASSASPSSGGKRGKGEAEKALASPIQEHQFFTATFTNTEQLTSFDETLANIGFTMPVAALRNEGWTLERPEVLALMKKLRAVGKPLGEYVEGQIFYGIKTGLNEAFVIDEETRQRLIAEDPRSSEIIKPWLRGKDIRKWQAQWAGLYVLFTRRGTNIDQYPAVKRHLEIYRKDLEPKRSDADKNGRKPGPYKWFEIQDNIAYFEEFEKEKILWPGITSEIVFGLGDKGQYGNDNNQLIISSDRCLLAILNSRLIRFVLQQICDKVRGGFFRMKMIYVEQLPIPPATDAQKAPIVERVKKILAAKQIVGASPCGFPPLVQVSRYRGSKPTSI